MSLGITIVSHVPVYDTALIEGAYTAASLIQAGVGLDEIEAQLKPLTIKD
nr:hypothetical protein [Lactobacillus taiwanensis]